MTARAEQPWRWSFRAGRCYRRAGWTPVGHTRGGLLTLQLLPADFPPACPARPLYADKADTRFDRMAA